MPGHEGEPPTVAAIVPNYNYERFVADAVSSLLAQTVPFSEIVVVDDGSVDESLSVLEQFTGQIRVVRKPNGGQLSAVWAGLTEISSDFVYVLDADDLADANLVETVLPLLASRPVKLQFQLHSMDEFANPIDSVFPTYGADYGSERMVADNEALGFYVCPPTSGNVFRADYLRELSRADLNEREAFDGVVAQAAPYFGSSISINTSLARYRVHGTSDSQWGQPTPGLLRSEIKRFAARWVEVDSILATSGRPSRSPRKSAYVLERELMIAVLEGRRAPLAVVRRYVARILRSGVSRSQRVALSGWAISLTVLPPRRGASMVLSRRSAVRRGALVSLIARLARTTRPSA